MHATRRAERAFGQFQYLMSPLPLPTADEIALTALSTIRNRVHA